MPGSWTCATCGAVWSSDNTKCFNCDPAGAAPPGQGLPPVPEVAPAAAPAPPVPAPPAPSPFQVPDFQRFPPGGPPPFGGQPGWRDRNFGDLFTETFVLFGTHFHWVASVVVACLVPFLAWQFIANLYFGMDNPRMQSEMVRDLKAGGEFPVRFMSLIVAGWLVSLTTNAFMGAAIYGTLAAAGRGEAPTVPGALRNGANGFVAAMATGLWVALRLIPWFLLFIIPGIIKTYAWALAVPARLTGDADNAEDAIGVSAASTDGRKLTLFGIAFLLGMIVAGITLTFTVFMKVSPMLARPLAGQIPTILNSVLSMMVGALVLLGYWLVYADAIAPLNPQSPAVRFRAGEHLPASSL